MAKIRKKYDPSRNRQRHAADILATTFFYHGSMMENPGALCGNFKYSLTDQDAAAILRQPHTWAGLILAFCQQNGQPYTRAMAVDEKNKISRFDLDKKLEQLQRELLAQCTESHICSTGYFIVPDNTVDVYSARSQITALFEKENPYDYTVTVLAGMARENSPRKKAA